MLKNIVVIIKTTTIIVFKNSVFYNSYGYYL